MSIVCCRWMVMTESMNASIIENQLSKYQASKYHRGVDHVDALIAQWREQRPDLDLAPMATIGRLGRLHALASARIEGVLREHGLGIGEFDVLAALRRAGPPHAMAPSALARLVMLTAAGMTNRVDR